MRFPLTTALMYRVFLPMILLAVGACQSQYLPEDGQNSDSSPAGQIVTQYASLVSGVYRARMSNHTGRAVIVGSATSTNSTNSTNSSSGYTDYGFGNWNPWGGIPYSILGGGNYLYSSPQDNNNQCLSFVQTIQETAQNYSFMVVSLARCLTITAQNQNPLLTYGYRSMNGSGQEAWRYLLDAFRPGPFGQFAGRYFVYHPYASTGIAMNVAR